MKARFCHCLIMAVGVTLCGVAVSVCDAAPKLRVDPARVTLDGPETSQQLLVTDTSEKPARDFTHAVRYQSGDAKVVVINDTGRVLPRGDGRTTITVIHDGKTMRIPVTVRGYSTPRPVSFRREIIPIFSKAGCNSGGCHGKAEGQAGFKLSIFGSDPLADHGALVKEARGRRVRVSAPTESLLLRKSLATMPHGGGRKVASGSLWDRRITRWIREGAVLDADTTRKITAIEVVPSTVVMSFRKTQQLRVTAIDSDGHRHCVTVEADYQSNAGPVADVDVNGVITAADATFLRRVFLDTIGTLPTVDEARAFLKDKHPHKRSRLIDRLLVRDEYADYRAMRWADLLRADSLRVTSQGTVAMTRWLRQQFKINTPYDKFVREILTARGNTLSEGPAAFYQVHNSPELLGRAVSQLFLGVRIECAQCHHHPFEKWDERDYIAFSGFFTGVKQKAGPTGGQKITLAAGADLKHPRTKQTVPTAVLGATPADLKDATDRRAVLAKWMTSPDNPYFSRMIANRLWAHYFGRGLVEPIDDMRTTNPATNEALLDALANHLVAVKFDLKAFTRTLLNSRVYQLGSRPNESNRNDDRNYSRAVWKALPAEVLLDAICQSTGIAEKFNGWPEGYRAIQVWDNRMPSYFFRIFGKPQRLSVCECERGNEPSIAQALHLMNSPEAVRKIRHRTGRAMKLATSKRSADEIIEELYLTTLSRLPSPKEIALMRQAFAESKNRRAATEDILWVLLNTREFVYNH